LVLESWQAKLEQLAEQAALVLDPVVEVDLEGAEQTAVVHRTAELQHRSER